MNKRTTNKVEGLEEIEGVWISNESGNHICSIQNHDDAEQIMRTLMPQVEEMKNVNNTMFFVNDYVFSDSPDIGLLVLLTHNKITKNDPKKENCGWGAVLYIVPVENLKKEKEYVYNRVDRIAKSMETTIMNG